jgi:hypothetical protein
MNGQLNAAMGTNFFVNWADVPRLSVYRTDCSRHIGCRRARRGDELLFAWAEAGETPQVRTAVARHFAHFVDFGVNEN